ncbi:Mitochondrial ATPase complex subunit atp10 [Cryptotrichosporon argae]
MPRRVRYFPAPTPAPAPDPNSEYTVPPLARPPGTPVPPVAADKSWAQRKDELLDRERHAASRRALVREATQGYFHDYNRVKRNGGKLWIGPPVLIREDRALYFPNISGKTLLSAPAHTTSLLAGHVSLVTVVNTRVSDEHVRSLAGPALDDWARVPGFRHVTINHQANALKSLLLGLFIGSLRSSVPKDEWGTYLISSGEWSPIDITGPLGIDNKLLGYVFLVDDACRIRWAGCGQAQGTEADDLRRATAVLMRRWQERTGAAAGAAETEIA